MDSLKEVFEKHTIVIQNLALRQGFTQIPNYVFKDKRLSFGARITYGILLSYAWQAGSCFPGQDKIAADLGAVRKTVNRFLQELRKAGYIDWKRRGLGKTNIYYILDVQIEADVTQRLHLDVTRGSHLDVTPGLH